MEYLNTKPIPFIIDRMGGGDLDKYWDELKRLRSSPNGIFGYKAFVLDFQFIAQNHEQLLSKITPDHIVYITRRDKLAQMVSYAKAAQTQVWFRGSKSKVQPTYDHALLKQAEFAIDSQERSWEKIFKLKNVEPLRVYYEDLLADPLKAVADVASLMNISLSSTDRISIPDIDKQADEVNAEWIRRYEAEQTENINR